MVSKVVFSQKALGQLDNTLSYLINTLGSTQAANNVYKDAKDTSERLIYLAEKIQLPTQPQLRKLGYRIIHFKHHKYIMIYRIVDEIVFIEAIYHASQDYENNLR